MKKLTEAMRSQHLSVSFEVVARCLSHHGQLPNSEYLVATAITRLCPDGRIEVSCSHVFHPTYLVCTSISPTPWCLLPHQFQNLFPTEESRAPQVEKPSTFMCWFLAPAL